MSKMDWKLYIENYSNGTKKYLLKENMQNIEKCRKKLKLFQIVAKFFNMTLLLACVVFFIRIFSKFSQNIVDKNICDTINKKLFTFLVNVYKLINTKLMVIY